MNSAAVAGSHPPPRSRTRRQIWLRRCLLGAVLLGVVGGVLFLWIARNQARAMFRFVDEENAQRTKRPESLSPWQKAKVIVGGVTVPRPHNRTDPKQAYGWDFHFVETGNGRGDRLSYWQIAPPIDPSESRSAHASKPLLVMFHGYAASKESLLPACQQFRELGCECWLVDFFGSGDSSGNHTSFGWFEAHDVDAVARLAEKTESAKSPNHRRPVVLYGVSMGGSAVMRALAELQTPADGAIIESVFHDLYGTVANRFHLMNLPAFPAADLLLWFGGRDLGFDARQHSPIKYAQGIHEPILLLHGSHDTRAPVIDARKIHATLPGPAEIVEFDAAHLTLASKNPERWRRATKAFFQSISPASSSSAAAAAAE